MTVVGNDILRAATWDEYIGQDDVKRRLDLHIRAALADERMMDHVLLIAPPGYGKTTLAQIIASQLGDPFEVLKMPVKATAFSAFLRQFEGGVLFLDEIHAASAAQQEELYTLLEDGYVTTSSGRTITVDYLTVIAGTTEAHKIKKPLYDRFAITPKFEQYTDDQMAQIIQSMAGKAGFSLDPELTLQLSRAAGGTPRRAKRIVYAARDLAAVRDDVTLGNILDLTDLDPDGLSPEHKDYLNVLFELGGVAGVEKIASMLQMHKTVVEDYERLLVKRRYVVYGDRGRELTQAGNRKVRGGRDSGGLPRNRIRD